MTKLSPDPASAMASAYRGHGRTSEDQDMRDHVGAGELTRAERDAVHASLKYSADHDMEVRVNPTRLLSALTASEAEVNRMKTYASGLFEKLEAAERREAGIRGQMKGDRRAAEAREAALVEVLTDATANLTGAASAYRKYAARHRSVGRATTDAMFKTRAIDFERAAERARQALAAYRARTEEEAG